MATKSENADIAVLQTQMASVEAATTRIEAKIDTQSQSYVTKAEFDEYKRGQNWQKIFLIFVSAIIGSLITYFITTAGKL